MSKLSSFVHFDTVILSLGKMKPGEVRITGEFCACTGQPVVVTLFEQGILLVFCWQRSVVKPKHLSAL